MKLLKTKQLAQYLGLSKAHIHRLVLQDKIPYHRPTGVNGGLFFIREEIDEWIMRGGDKGRILAEVEHKTVKS